MSKRDAADFRRERAEDLRKLSDVLENNILGFDAGRLKAASSQCRSESLPQHRDWSIETSPYTWGYSLDYLVFSGYAPSSDLRPATARDREVSILLDAKVVGESSSSEGVDPFSVLAVELRVVTAGEPDQVHSAWHLDKHKRSGGDTERAVHPEYHMQYGGKHLWASVEDYGDLIISEPPRLVHPPLDAVLAVDFVLSNFFWQQWRDLREKSEYIDIVCRAQKLFWKPYVRALAGAWNPGSYKDETWPADLVWPQFCKKEGL